LRTFAYYELSGTTIQSKSVKFLRIDSQLGLTPEPCSGIQLFSLPTEPAPNNEARKSNSGLIYQLVQGRLGQEGQQVNAYLNAPKQHVGFAGWFDATPYIWAAIEFDNSGTALPILAGGLAQIFPTYLVYQNGALVQTITQSQLQAFIALDATSYFVPPF